MKKKKTIEITPLALDLGREDLNSLVAKVNEIISHLNGTKDEEGDKDDADAKEGSASHKGK